MKITRAVIKKHGIVIFETRNERSNIRYNKWDGKGGHGQPAKQWFNEAINKQIDGENYSAHLSQNQRQRSYETNEINQKEA